VFTQKVKRLKNLKTVLQTVNSIFDFALSNQNKDFLEDQLAKRTEEKEVCGM
jgi:hypothetical protein